MFFVEVVNTINRRWFSRVRLRPRLKDNKNKQL